MKVAVEGCLHGELDAVYNALLQRERREGIKIDLLICCGDFQALRNHEDMRWMKVPDKYKTMGTFYKYYSGEVKAPILTLFVGGNHEASNHLTELGYGGWVAPNIFYLGYSGVVQFRGLRIAGVSGIYNHHHYHLGHYERPPFNKSMLTSAYHVRSFEVFKLKQLSGKIDVFVSHDWPVEIYHHGDKEGLLRWKPFFRKEIGNNSLGSPACKELLDHLRPARWWAGHLHCRFEAKYIHKTLPSKMYNTTSPTVDTPTTTSPTMDTPTTTLPTVDTPTTTSSTADMPTTTSSTVDTPTTTFPKVTEFLALDKCLPKRQFLEVFDLPDNGGPPVLCYDLQWIAVTRAINHVMPLDNSPWQPPSRTGNARSSFVPTEEEMKEAYDLFKGDFSIPKNFQMSAKPFNPMSPWQQGGFEGDNPQTVEFCEKLKIRNNFSSDLAKDVHQLSTISRVPQHVAQGNPDEIALDEDSEEEDTTNQESTSLAPPSEIMPIPAQSTNEESEPEIKKRKEV